MVRAKVGTGSEGHSKASRTAVGPCHEAMCSIAESSGMIAWADGLGWRRRTTIEHGIGPEGFMALT